MNDFYSAGMYWRLKWRATYTYELEIVQLPVLEFTFNRLDIGRLNVQFTENPHQCSSSHDAYNPIPHVRWRRKHADIGEPLSALLGLWEVSVGLLKCNQPRGCASDEWLKMLLLEIVLGVKKSWCFSHCLSRFDRERSNDEVLFFDCFCSIASKIEVSFVQMC